MQKGLSKLTEMAGRGLLRQLPENGSNLVFAFINKQISWIKLRGRIADSITPGRGTTVGSSNRFFGGEREKPLTNTTSPLY